MSEARLSSLSMVLWVGVFVSCALVVCLLAAGAGAAPVSLGEFLLVEEELAAVHLLAKPWGIDRGRPEGHAPVVLVVEDNDAHRHTLAAILSGMGLTVVSAENLPGARRALARTVDIAFVDTNLAGADGTTLAPDLEVRRIPFALCCAYRKQAERLRFPDTPILAKPFRLMPVEIMAQQLLAKASG